jgi:hypothetical protein
MKLPDAITKRDILFGAKRVSPDVFLTYARAYVDAGLWSDAIDFYSKSEKREGLEELVQKVLHEGDMFLLLKMQHLFGEEFVSDDSILTCAKKAESLGKTRYAIMGYEKLGNESQVTALRETIADDGDIVALREAATFVAANLEEIQDSSDLEDA